MNRVAIIGGGAAGYFTAINWAEKHPNDEVIILEKAKNVLQKVKVSGGGRCNVTHYCFDPRELTKNYPRGSKELIGPFNKFNPGDTIGWLAERGVELHVEEDNRMFPSTNDSQTIIDCFLKEAEKYGVKLWNLCGVKSILQKEEQWELLLSNDKTERFDKVVCCSGSNIEVWKLLKKLGLKMVDPVPSLFTFRIKDDRIKELPGIAKDAEVKVIGSKISAYGPVLITHKGLSGPAILRLSAWGARILHQQNYQFKIAVNWCSYKENEVLEDLKAQKENAGKRKVSENNLFEIPKRLWKELVSASTIKPDTNWGDLGKVQLSKLAQQLTSCEFQVNGKNTFKEEFVTAGGVDLSEIDFRKMEAKRFSGLYFAGEVLDIDAITGGFNFQAAWTTSWLVSEN